MQSSKKTFSSTVPNLLMKDTLSRLLWETTLTSLLENTSIYFKQTLLFLNVSLSLIHNSKFRNATVHFIFPI